MLATKNKQELRRENVTVDRFYCKTDKRSYFIHIGLSHYVPVTSLKFDQFLMIFVYFMKLEIMIV